MVLPILAYGHRTLKLKAVDIPKGYPGLNELIESMFETMYGASGVGLAAPQIGQSLRLFIVDASPFAEDEEHADLEGFKKVFINPVIIGESGPSWAFEEGCLSIPKVREDVMRKPKVTIRYLDENFQAHESQFDGIPARIIQHEYDHLEGVLFTDRISPLKKRFLKRKLMDISIGKVEVPYKMNFPNVKAK